MRVSLLEWRDGYNSGSLLAELGSQCKQIHRLRGWNYNAADSYDAARSLHFLTGLQYLGNNRYTRKACSADVVIIFRRSPAHMYVVGKSGP